MGDFWFSRGDTSAALKCYTRARDYCSSPEQTRLWCLNVIKCHIALEQYHSIASYVARAVASRETSIEHALGSAFARQMCASRRERQESPQNCLTVVQAP